MAMSKLKKCTCRRKLEKLLPAAYDNYTELVPAIELMVKYRKETVSQMNYVADQLNARRHDVNIAKIVGSSAGVLGSAIGALGLAITPFTFGIGALVGGGGAALAALGTTAAAGAHLVEKVLEKVDLEKVQQAVDRDREQCERVRELWDKFDRYCNGVLVTIMLADPANESDVKSLKTWVLVAVKETKSCVSVIAETLHEAFLELFPHPAGEELILKLGETAMKIVGKKINFKSVVSWIARNSLTVCLTGAFLLICLIFVGNIWTLITTSFNMHKGSLSQVAEDVRNKASQLQQEHEEWHKAFLRSKEYVYR
jgi:hypothetical protein